MSWRPWRMTGPVEFASLLRFEIRETGVLRDKSDYGEDAVVAFGIAERRSLVL
ncbi:MAG: hypothetical protein HQ518_10910 [Rhodopirellula sp.]|nr:hypothetical protein [Rhodopirellula sp.]